MKRQAALFLLLTPFGYAALWLARGGVIAIKAISRSIHDMWRDA